MQRRILKILQQEKWVLKNAWDILRKKPVQSHLHRHLKSILDGKMNGVEPAGFLRSVDLKMEFEFRFDFVESKILQERIDGCHPLTIEG